jgi:hypothetical protein
MGYIGHMSYIPLLPTINSIKTTFMNQIKSNFGLIVLSISIVIASLVLSEDKEDTTYQGIKGYYGLDESKINLSGDISGRQIPIGINTNGNDVTYNSKLELGNGQQLVVELSNRTEETIKGQNIIATYFHVAKLLVVSYESEEQKMIRYFNSPIAWRNKK